MKVLKIIIVNLLVLCALLGAMELLLWQFDPAYKYYYRSHPAQADLAEILAKTDTFWLETDADLGWVCQQKSLLQFPAAPVQNVHYRINAEGFRNDLDFSELGAKTKKRILLLGDSFTFGIYLSEQETMTARLQEILGPEYQVINLAVPAWGLDQMYFALQKYMEQIDPDQIIVNFVDDDLMRSLEIIYHGCGRKPCYKLEEDRLVENLDEPHLWEYLCWNNQLGNRLLVSFYESKAAELGAFYLENLISNAKHLDLNVTIVRIPAAVDLLNRVPREKFSMKELCATYQVNYVDLYDGLVQKSEEEIEQLYIPDDGHFTAAGVEHYLKFVCPLIHKKPAHLNALK